MARDWRYHVAVEPIDITFDDTDQIDLPSEGVISKMEILVETQNVATISDSHRRRLAEHITNVAITGDTNDILHDLNAMQSRVFAMDTEQKIPPEEHRGYDSAFQNTVIPIYFGRYARDEHYGLDLSKWTNVRLALTNDFTDAWFDVAETQVSVRLLWTFNPAIAPAKYLAKTIVDEQSVTAADRWARPVILPVRYPVRRLGVEGYIPTLNASTDVGNPKATLDNSIEEIKLWKQARKDLVWDDSLRQLMRFNADEYGHSLIESYLDHGDPANALWTDTALADLDVVAEMLYGTAPTLVNDWAESALDFERHHAMTQWPNTAGTHAGLMAYGRGYNSTGIFRFYSWTPREILGDTDEEWLHPGVAGDGVCELMYMIGDTDVQARTLIEQAIPHPATA
jgi:hypothetical protein